ncbi:MAG: polysaccharide biosynthesis/export family protein [Verrucomicrobiae bacterium]|nr:polysaccharide biosynthesis/export family protein [Verrucomicrobiae bacterium]
MKTAISVLLLSIVSYLYAQEPSPITRGSNPNNASNTAVGALGPASMATLDDRRPLAIGDVVSYRVLEDQDPPVQRIVTDSGEIDVPYYGRIRAVGRTPKQLAYAIKAALEQTLYKRATVIIALDQATKSRGRIYVVGMVRQQGPIEIPADEVFTVGKAILRAGGFSDFANKRKVTLVRGGGGQYGKIQDINKTPDGAIVVDLVNVLEKGRINEDVQVHAGDLIIVPQKIVNF